MHHIPLEEADDLAVALAVFLTFADIGERWRMVTHPDDRDAIQRGIGLPTAAVVEPEAVGFAARRRYRTEAAELGDRGFGTDPARIVGDQVEHFQRRHRGDSVRCDQCRRAGGDELFERLVMCLDLMIQYQPAVAPGRVWRFWPKRSSR